MENMRVKIAGERVKLQGEVLHGIRVVKFYGMCTSPCPHTQSSCSFTSTCASAAWEKAFIRRMQAFRAKETTLLRKMNFGGCWALPFANEATHCSHLRFCSQVLHRHDVHDAPPSCRFGVVWHVHGLGQCDDCPSTCHVAVPCNMWRPLIVCCALVLAPLCCRSCSRRLRSSTPCDFL